MNKILICLLFSTSVLIAQSPQELDVNKLIKKHYECMAKQDIDGALKLYHSKSDFVKDKINSKAQLVKFFKKYKTTYKLSDFRYIGDDKKYFVAIYREKTEFYDKIKKKVESKIDSEVLMVFKYEKGTLKIYSSTALQAL